MRDHRRAARAQRVSGGMEPEVVRVWLLGGFRVSVGSRSIEASGWRLRKAMSLVKLLALARGHRLHRGQVMDLFWPNLETEAAANNLHRVLHFARGSLEVTPSNTTSRHLQLQGDMLALCPDGMLWVDVEAFEEAAATARRIRDPVAHRSAIELYTGELLPEDRYEEWTQERRAELRRTYLELLAELARLHEEREEYEPAIAVLRLAASEEPAGEETHVALMRLYALAGRRHEAILQYERLREALSGAWHGARRRQQAPLRRDTRREIPGCSFAPSWPPPEELAGPSRHNLPASLTSFVGREPLVVSGAWRRARERGVAAAARGRVVAVLGRGGFRGRQTVAPGGAGETPEGSPSSAPRLSGGSAGSSSSRETTGAR